MGSCGYGTRMPLLVVSPFAKRNYVDHILTDQSSVLRFIEGNWLSGQRIQPGGSFDTIAGPLDNMFNFDDRNDERPNKLVRDEATGAVVSAAKAGHDNRDQHNATVLRRGGYHLAASHSDRLIPNHRRDSGSRTAASEMFC
jgi:phospholipase C